jgi:hypothetical protein
VWLFLSIDQQAGIAAVDGNQTALFVAGRAKAFAGASGDLLMLAATRS